MLTKSNNIWLITIGGTIGNLTEWYNFLLYSYLASIFAQLFFPIQDKLLSLALVFTVFALGFVVRPVGGIIFGWIGDTYGRQRALIISLLCMAVPSLFISCLPTYHMIGIASPILLCILRILQGLSAGGEHTGSAVYMLEHAPLHKHAYWISTVPASAALGILISSATALLLTKTLTSSELLAWGWRAGYWIGTSLCVFSIYLRVKMPETPIFHLKQTTTSHRLPMVVLLKNKFLIKKLMMVISLAASWGIFYQIIFIWMPTYLSQVQHFNHSMTLFINTAYLFIFALLIIAMGFCADYINRKFLIVSACTSMLLFALPLFQLLASGSLLQVLLAMGIFTFIFSVFLPATFVSMAELFPSEIRYTGLSFGFNLGLALFGGTTPLIATWLIHITNNPQAPAYYMQFAAILGLTTAYFLPSAPINQQSADYIAYH